MAHIQPHDAHTNVFRCLSNEKRAEKKTKPINFNHRHAPDINSQQTTLNKATLIADFIATFWVKCISENGVYFALHFDKQNGICNYIHWILAWHKTEENNFWDFFFSSKDGTLDIESIAFSLVFEICK